MTKIIERKEIGGKKMNKYIKKLILLILIVLTVLVGGCTENNSKLTDQESNEFKYSNDELYYYYYYISEDITYLKTHGTHVEINDYYEYINLTSDNTVIVLIHDNETERVFINPYFIEDDSIIVSEQQRYVVYNKSYLFLTSDTFDKIQHNIHHSIQVDYDIRK